MTARRRDRRGSKNRTLLIVGSVGLVLLGLFTLAGAVGVLVWMKGRDRAAAAPPFAAAGVSAPAGISAPELTKEVRAEMVRAFQSNQDAAKAKYVGTRWTFHAEAGPALAPQRATCKFGATELSLSVMAMDEASVRRLRAGQAYHFEATVSVMRLDKYDQLNFEFADGRVLGDAPPLTNTPPPLGPGPPQPGR